MGLAPLAHILWSRHLRHNPEDPSWIGRDRFVLSNGHACALQYTMLHLLGYPAMDLKALKAFRSLNSITPGHPECNHTPGIEVTTGPLGQGIANGVGIAIAEAHLRATNPLSFKGLPPCYTYVVAGDGCMMEGVSGEASSLAGHLGLGGLILIYDDNQITIDGPCSIAFTEDVLARYSAYGWHCQTVQDGNTDLEAIDEAISKAKAVTDRPSIIALKTRIGFSSSKEGTAKCHGSPLGAEEVAIRRKDLGGEPFTSPKEVENLYKEINEREIQNSTDWMHLFQCNNPPPALLAQLRGEIVAPDWKDLLPTYTSADPPVATRKLSEAVIAKLAPALPNLLIGSADLAASNLVDWPGSHDFQHNSYDGQMIRYGVREHGMAGICNGIASFGAHIPLCSTFLNFITYAWGAVRLSALSGHRVIYVMTHDSIGLGEDGPTHQPVEVMALLRATPNLLCFRPADGNEVSGAYQAALLHHGPTVICLSRQGLPQLDGSSCEKTATLGAYTLPDTGNTEDTTSPDLLLLASGSEVSSIVEAAHTLRVQEGLKVEVVSVPCMDLLMKEENRSYRQALLDKGCPIISMESSSIEDSWKISHHHMGMRGFGASAPADVLYRHFNLQASDLVDRAKKILSFYASSPVPAINRPLPSFEYSA